MGKLYAKRFLRRFCYGMARPFFWGAICGSVCIGLLIGWILFAQPHHLGESDFGNVADWVAAIGTWVIGYGAWKYARENYAHRVQEVKDQQREDRKRKRARLKAMEARAKKGHIPAVGLEHFNAQDEDVRTQRLLAITIDHILAGLFVPALTAERVDDDNPRLTRLLDQVQLYAVLFEQQALHMRSIIDPAAFTRLTNFQTPILGTTANTASHLKKAADELLTALKAERDKIAV